jgi:hypothetical protein
MPPKTPANARGTASLSEPPASPATSDVTILSGPDLFALAANRTAEERRALENVIVERDAEVQALKTSLSDSEATVQLLRSGQSEKIVEAEKKKAAQDEKKFEDAMDGTTKTALTNICKGLPAEAVQVHGRIPCKVRPQKGHPLPSRAANSRRALRRR